MIIVMKKWMKYRASVVFFFVTWFLLVISFTGNFFGVGLWQSWFDGFQRDSSAIIEKTALCKEKSSYSGPLIVTKNEDYNSVMMSEGCDTSLLKPYASQYGLQARIITALAPKDNAKLPSYFKKVNILLSAAMAALMALVALRVRKLFGFVAAGATSARPGGGHFGAGCPIRADFPPPQPAERDEAGPLPAAEHPGQADWLLSPS